MRQIDSLDRIKPEIITCYKPRGQAYTIKIRNQKQFDGLNELITKAIVGGYTNIRVKIAKGVYHYREYHILRENEKAEKVSITIEGRNATITSDIKYGSTLDDDYTDLEFADGLVEIVDLDKRMCFMPYKNTFDTKQRKRYKTLQISQWYRSVKCEVVSINDRGVYFIAPSLYFDNQFGRDGYNVNYDYLYQGINPRFRLIDPSKELDYKASRFIALVYSSFASFTVKGLHFASNKSGASLISTSHLDVKQMVVEKCSFEKIRGSVANISCTDNVVIRKNTIYNTEGNEIVICNGSRNIHVVNNLFDNCGQSITSTFCITCNEAQYFVAENVFRDFGYGAIGVGIWYGHEKNKESTGIIEHNEMYYTPNYFKNKSKHTLMDSGAIYSWTQNDGTIIRYNYIHDYVGMGDNRGIFCDDGASNLKIYGNIILNTPNSYSIDSRFAKDKKEGVRCNVNNFIASNIIDNRIRFMGYEKESRHCIKGSNIVLNTKGKSLDDIVENLDKIEPDIIVADFSYKEGKLTVPQEYQNMVKKVITK